MSDLAELGDADLIVGADGANSLVRRAHAAQFGPHLDRRRCRYSWLGTDLELRAFTFIFEETPHGLFQVHAYPFAPGRSTWIVECRAEVLERAGLGGAERGRDRRLLRAAVRPPPGRPPPVLQPLAMARLRDRALRALALRQRGAPRRRRAHRALLDRLGHQAGDGGRDRARRGARPPRPRRDRRGARRVRGGAPHRGREAAARRADQPRVVRELGALPRAAADPVHVQSDDPLEAHHLRQPAAAGSGADRAGERVVRVERRGAGQPLLRPPSSPPSACAASSSRTASW